MRQKFYLLLSLLAGGCQSGGGLVADFDGQSALTLTTDAAPAVFARTQGQLSQSARDYLYLGPVEVNERGLRQYYFWVAMASTIDRDYLAADSSGAQLLIFDIDGAPIEFELDRWDQRLPRLTGRKIYEPAVAPTSEFAARLTLDQLEMLAHAQVKRIRIVTDESSILEYQLWEETGWWPQFASHAGIR